MCLIALAWQAHTRYPLIVAANRDEFHARPTEHAGWWRHPAGLFAGRDQRAGGAWCGMDQRGRFAAVTNVREPNSDAGHASRGLLVRDYFATCGDSAEWVAHLRDTAQQFGPFNLLIGDRDALWFVSNRGAVRERSLKPGVYAIANGHWGDHWPQTERAATRLHAALAADRCDDAALFDLLADTEPAADTALPDTGIGLAQERQLSPAFIRGPDYGTRASTVIRRDHANTVTFCERSFDAAARCTYEVRESWQIN